MVVIFYNEEIKNAFMKEYFKNRVVSHAAVIGLFKKVAFYEEEISKDCCNFTQEEILSMYRAFDAKAIKVLENYNSILKAYVAYCVYYRKFLVNNIYESITKEMMSGCIDPKTRDKMILTIEQFEDIQNSLLNSTDKAIMECLWNGISGKSMCDLVAINKDSISPDGKYIILSGGRKVPMTKKLNVYLEKAFKEDKYIFYGKRFVVQDLLGKDSLYKELVNAYADDSDDKMFRWVYRKIRTFRSYVGIPTLTMKNIAMSGLLYNIKKGMKETKEDFRTFLASERGRNLALQYGYEEKFYVTVLIEKCERYIENK